jgi:hypothetical protein
MDIFIKCVRAYSLSVTNITHCLLFYGSGYIINKPILYGSVNGIATGCRLVDRGIGVRVQVGARIFSSPRRPDRLCGPPNLLSNGYQGLLPLG